MKLCKFPHCNDIATHGIFCGSCDKIVSSFGFEQTENFIGLMDEIDWKQRAVEGSPRLGLTPLQIQWPALSSSVSEPYGFYRGEIIAITGSAGRFRTGLLASLFAQIAYTNAPQLIDHTKQGALVVYLTETEEADFLRYLYLYFKVSHEGGEVGDHSRIQLTNDNLEWLQQQLIGSGYAIFIVRIDPTAMLAERVTEKLKLLAYEHNVEIHGLFMEEPMTAAVPVFEYQDGASDPLSYLANFCEEQGTAFFYTNYPSGMSWNAADTLAKSDKSPTEVVLELYGARVQEKLKGFVPDQEIFIHCDRPRNSDEGGMLAVMAIRPGEHREIGTPEPILVPFENTPKIPWITN